VATVPERIFFDGECGLCHRWVRFALARARGRELFRFAPLQGATFAAEVPEAARRALPDSLVVRTGDGRLLVRSAAVLHVLRRTGGAWGALAALVGIVPPALADWGYDRIASVRKRWFARPAELCPLVPPELARRFDP
jgi:predicted DCC family thiol-disulfide oxidoreductase YuxK